MEKETKENTVQQGKGKVNAGLVGQALSITLCKMDVGCAWLYTEHRASISERLQIIDPAVVRQNITVISQIKAWLWGTRVRS